MALGTITNLMKWIYSSLNICHPSRHPFSQNCLSSLFRDLSQIIKLQGDPCRYMLFEYSAKMPQVVLLGIPVVRDEVGHGYHRLFFVQALKAWPHG